MDLKLKDMSGFEFLDKLKNENIEKLPIIIHTKNGITEEDELELQKFSPQLVYVDNENRIQSQRNAIPAQAA